MEPCKYVELFEFLDDGLVCKLPREPGEYLWFIADSGYLRTGVVLILEDSEKHKRHLREHCPEVYIYTNAAGKELTMYHQAHDHLPPLDESKKPFVDGYVRFKFEVINDRMTDWPKWADRHEL